MDYKQNVTMDSSGFVLLADLVPGIVQEIRYYSTYNFMGERVDGYDPLAVIDAMRRKLDIIKKVEETFLVKKGDQLSVSSPFVSDIASLI